MCIKGKACIFATGCFFFFRSAAASGGCSEAGKWCGTGGRSDCFQWKLALFAGFKKKPPDLQIWCLVWKMIRARLWIQCAFVLPGIEWIYQNGRVGIEGNVWAVIFESKNFVGVWTVYLRVFCNVCSKVDKSHEVQMVTGGFALFVQLLDELLDELVV